jgi:hypothetical protein
MGEAEATGYMTEPRHEKKPGSENKNRLSACSESELFSFLEHQYRVHFIKYIYSSKYVSPGTTQGRPATN